MCVCECVCEICFLLQRYDRNLPVYYIFTLLKALEVFYVNIFISICAYT